MTPHSLTGILHSPIDWPYLLAFALLAFLVYQPKFDFHVDLGVISLHLSSGSRTDDNGHDQTPAPRRAAPAKIPGQQQEAGASVCRPVPLGNGNGGRSAHSCGKDGGSDVSVEVVEQEPPALTDSDDTDSSSSACVAGSSTSESSLCKRLTMIAEKTRIPMSSGTASAVDSCSPVSSLSSSGGKASSGGVSGYSDNGAGTVPSGGGLNGGVMVAHVPAMPILGDAIPPLNGASMSISSVAAIRAAASEFQPGTGWLRPHGSSPTGEGKCRKRPPEEFMYRAVSQLQCAFDAMEEDVGQVDKTAQELEVEVTRLAAEVGKLRAEVKGLKGLKGAMAAPRVF